MSSNLTIIHGEQTHLSRLKMVELQQVARKNQQEVIIINAKNLQPQDLELHLGSNSLFGNDHYLVIEELHSLPISSRRKTLIQMISESSISILLWEKKSLSKTQLKTLNPGQALEFKPSSIIFKWLDSLSPNPATKNSQLTLLTQAIESEGAELCFVLLIRQVRLLIMAKTGSKIPGAPFMITKLSSQAKAFPLEKLLQLHSNLLKIDIKAKTSSIINNLASELDLLLIRL